jgi:hypothetical protein
MERRCDMEGTHCLSHLRPSRWGSQWVGAAVRYVSEGKYFLDEARWLKTRGWWGRGVGVRNEGETGYSTTKRSRNRN